jgi:hypothetical protein
LPNQFLGKNLIALNVKKISNNPINSGYILKKIVRMNPNSAYNQFNGELFIKNNVDKCLLKNYFYESSYISRWTGL